MSVTGQTQIDLDDGEVERIIRDEEANRAYLVEVTGSNPVRVGHTKRYARDGNTLSARQTHTVSNLRGEELYAAAFDGPTSIRVRVAAADVDSQPETNVNVVSGNIDINRRNALGATAFSQTVDSEQDLISQEVPNGFEAVLLAADGNDDHLLVEGFPLAAGDSLALGVEDTSQITVDAASGSQTVHVITEVD